MASPGHLPRVKVYLLNEDGFWDDRGTGHVTVEYVRVRCQYCGQRCSLSIFSWYADKKIAQLCWVVELLLPAVERQRVLAKYTRDWGGWKRCGGLWGLKGTPCVTQQGKTGVTSDKYG